MDTTGLISFLENYKTEDKNENIRVYGSYYGCFKIPLDKYNEFLELVNNFTIHKNISILEVPPENNIIVVDFDINGEISENRLYNKKTIKSVIKCYNKVFKKYNLDLSEIEYYVLEKNQPTIKNDKMKDGFHIFINGYKFSVKDRQIIYNEVNKLIDEKNIFNEKAEKINDKAVINSNGWFIYGCGKPGLDPYKITYYYKDNELEKFNENEIPKIKIIKELSFYKNKSQIVKLEIIETETEEDNEVNYNSASPEIIKRLLRCLSSDRADDYNNWINVAFVIKNYYPHLKDDFDEFSKLSNKYNKKENDKYWSSIKPKIGGFTIGSLFYWAKQDNEKEYNKIIQLLKSTSNNSNLDEWYLNKKQEIEKIWFKLNYPLKFVRYYNGELQFYTKKEAYDYFENLNFTDEDKAKAKVKTHYFFDKWIKDINIKNFEKVIFDPLDNDPKHYNTFKGFELYDPTIVPEKVEEFDEIIKHIFDKKNYIDYFYKWIKHILTEPYKKTNVAIVLYSDIHGVGKNTLIELLNKLIGINYCSKIKNIEDIQATFNSHLSHKLLIYGDEIRSRARDVSSELKNVITQTEILSTKKYMDSVKLKDLSNWIFTTNDEISFKCEEQNRRLFCIEIKNKKEKEFYDNFYKALEDTNKLKKFFSYIINLDTQVELSNLPDTEYTKKLKTFSMDPITSYLFNNIEYYEDSRILVKDFYNNIISYAKNNHLTNIISFNFMRNIMNKLIEISENKIIKKHTKIGNKYVFPVKSELLKVLKKWNESHYINCGLNELEPNENGDSEIDEY